MTLRRRTAPLTPTPAPVPLGPPGVRVRTASFSAKHAPRQVAAGPPGAAKATKVGRRSTALCTVVPMSDHASRRGRRSQALNRESTSPAAAHRGARTWRRARRTIGVRRCRRRRLGTDDAAIARAPCRPARWPC